MMIQSFAWLGPPVQPCKVYLAGVVEGLLLRSYRYAFVYLYTILNPREGGRDL